MNNFCQEIWKYRQNGQILFKKCQPKHILLENRKRNTFQFILLGQTILDIKTWQDHYKKAKGNYMAVSLMTTDGKTLNISKSNPKIHSPTTTLRLF